MNESITFYNNSFLFVAAINRGVDGFFVTQNNHQLKEWKFVAPGSIQWDSLHQNIFRNHHDYELCSEANIKQLPTLPDIPQYKPVEWRQNFGSTNSYSPSQFPNIFNHILKIKNKTLKFWVILYEDIYETAMGDGKFIYFHDEIFFAKDQVYNFLVEKITEVWRRFYKKMVVLKIVNENLVVMEGNPEMFEHYKLEEIFIRINSMLSYQKPL
jgi:hypothetical protein